jgi:hypothetical protein
MREIGKDRALACYMLGMAGSSLEPNGNGQEICPMDNACRCS